MRDFAHRANRQAATRMTVEEYRSGRADNRARPPATVPPPPAVPAPGHAVFAPVPIRVHPPPRPRVVLPPVMQQPLEHAEPPGVAWDPYGGGGPPLGSGGHPLRSGGPPPVVVAHRDDTSGDSPGMSRNISMASLTSRTRRVAR